MGKQRRRKRQNNKGKSAAHSPVSVGNVADDTTPNTPNNVLLQRIRHADPRTRHAALAAVSTTLLDTSCARIHPKITPPLLQAIRERVMDSDLDVAQVAAGCMSNYLTIVSGMAETKTEIQTMTAGWTVLLVGRLRRCYEATISNAKESDLSIKDRKLRRHWLYLAVQCLHPLCTLIESNSDAVARLTSDFDPTTRRDFHQSLLEWLQVAHSWLVEHSNSARINSTQDEEEYEYYQKIVTLAARALHSAWDDNSELLVPWQQECPDAFNHGLALLQTCAQATAPRIPAVAKLHAIGCLVAGRPAEAVEMAQHIIHALVPHLHFDWPKVRDLLSTWMKAFKAWESEKEDDAMERDIIRKQGEKNEKSREIAKRQKETGKPEPMQEDETKDDSHDEELQDKKDTEMETREALEQSRSNWNEMLFPLQLALELLANLTSNTNDSESMQDEDDMFTEEWGPDQEVQFLKHQHQNQLYQRKKSEEEVLHKALVESSLPQQLARLFQQVYSTQQVEFPEFSRQDIEDLQYKTVACLGNCWGNIGKWPLHLAWNDLQRAVMEASGLGKEGLVSSMLVALKSQPAFRKQWHREHLAFWLQQLQNTSEEMLSVRRDTIGMLGVLCSQEPHPEEVNKEICFALLSVLTSTDNLMLQCEVLNVLMDMYGGDDSDETFHGTVFVELQVLKYFQQLIPSLKEKLKHHEKSLSADSMEHGEVEQWREIILNASRFVQYKKGQL